MSTWPDISNWCKHLTGRHGCKCDGCKAFRRAASLRRPTQPAWLRKMRIKNATSRWNEHPLGVGMRVYDVLYCGKYGSPWGVVTSVRYHRDGEVSVGVDTDDGGSCASSSKYWVPVPDELSVSSFDGV